VSTTLDPATLSAWQTVVRVQARVAARAEDALAEAGLPPLVWHDVLRTLQEAECGIRMFEVADAIVMSRSGLTRLIDRLEEAGLVERRRDDADRRAWRIHLTKAAAPVIAKLEAMGIAFNADILAGIDDADLETTIRVLARIRHNLDQIDQELEQAS